MLALNAIAQQTLLPGVQLQTTAAAGHEERAMWPCTQLWLGSSHHHFLPRPDVPPGHTSTDSPAISLAFSFTCTTSPPAATASIFGTVAWTPLDTLGGHIQQRAQRHDEVLEGRDGVEEIRHVHAIHCLANHLRELQV